MHVNCDDYVNGITSTLMFKKFLDVMLEKLPNEFPPKKRVDHVIKVTSRVTPPTKAPYQINHEELKELKVQLEKLLAKRYVKPNKSQYGVPPSFSFIRRMGH